MLRFVPSSPSARPAATAFNHGPLLPENAFNRRSDGAVFVAFSSVFRHNDKGSFASVDSNRRANEAEL